MDFLSKIKRHIQGSENKEFRKQVLKDKKQKYLFGDDITDKYHSTRAGFFRRNKRLIAPFSNSFGENFYRIKKRIVESYMLSYIGIVLLVLSGYIILFSPYFKVSPSHVLLEARNEGIDINVAYRSIEDIYGTSLFFLDEEKVAMMLKKALSNIAHIKIDKLYPSGIKILITSTPIAFQTRIYGFDREWQMSNNGVLIPRSAGTGSGSENTILQMEVISEALRGEVFFDYKQIISDERMLLINRIIELFSVEWTDLPIDKVRFFSRENELHITIKGGTTILLTLESESNSYNYNSRIENIKNQLLGLKTYVITNKNSLLDSSIIYIDARVVKKIFICRDKAICNNNLTRIYGETYR